LREGFAIHPAGGLVYRNKCRRKDFCEQ
jgi:hypothetical protein